MPFNGLSQAIFIAVAGSAFVGCTIYTM